MKILSVFLFFILTYQAQASSSHPTEFGCFEAGWSEDACDSDAQDVERRRQECYSYGTPTEPVWFNPFSNSCCAYHRGNDMNLEISCHKCAFGEHCHPGEFDI